MPDLPVKDVRPSAHFACPRSIGMPSCERCLRSACPTPTLSKLQRPKVELPEAVDEVRDAPDRPVVRGRPEGPGRRRRGGQHRSARPAPTLAPGGRRIDRRRCRARGWSSPTRASAGRLAKAVSGVRDRLMTMMREVDDDVVPRDRRGRPDRLRRRRDGRLSRAAPVHRDDLVRGDRLPQRARRGERRPDPGFRGDRPAVLERRPSPVFHDQLRLACGSFRVRRRVAPARLAPRGPPDPAAGSHPQERPTDEGFSDIFASFVVFFFWFIRSASRAAMGSPSAPGGGGAHMARPYMRRGLERSSDRLAASHDRRRGMSPTNQTLEARVQRLEDIEPSAA